ncbi:MAG: LTA synthase family protein [Phycisphaerales bacterium]|nr:MAG: LTA synthase family protein [Phycisphaerales bacterium]
MLASLAITLVAKLSHSLRYGLVGQYLSWILADIAVLLAVEIVLVMVCYRWPRKWTVRAAVAVATLVGIWSVMNAGWLIRTGTQILPTELLPLFRDPLNSLGIVLVNIIRMPKAGIILLTPAFVGLAFCIAAFAKPVSPSYNRKVLINKIIISAAFIGVSSLAFALTARSGSAQIASAGLRFNCHLRAVMSFVSPKLSHLGRADFVNPKREIPVLDKTALVVEPRFTNHNVVIVVLEGVQYAYTSLAAKRAGSSDNPTPYLSTLAGQGVEFTNARSTVTHTTKALFALLTGRFPSASQDIAEAVPIAEPYASLPAIVGKQLGFRTAFFQSAKGNFESRPGLVHNLGFDKFWSRDYLGDPNQFIGYLGCDEFAMLRPITDWIEAEQRPFLLTVLCSVTHDPYDVPEWFAARAKEPIDKYRQAISYTDGFLAALDVELTKLGIRDNTIFCVVGDHGEAFGEHGLLGHERIAFEEVLRIPWVVRTPFVIEPGTKITQAVSSVDLAPTLLALLGFDIASAEFDGADALGPLPNERKVYFSCWMRHGPAGFVMGNQKLVHNPTNKTVSVYDLASDPLESVRAQPLEPDAQRIADEIAEWRRNTIFRLHQQRSGKTALYGSWLCRWNNRVPSVKHLRQN